MVFFQTYDSFSRRYREMLGLVDSVFPEVEKGRRVFDRERLLLRAFILSVAQESRVSPNALVRLSKVSRYYHDTVPMALEPAAAAKKAFSEHLKEAFKEQAFTLLKDPTTNAGSLKVVAIISYDIAAHAVVQTPVGTVAAEAWGQAIDALLAREDSRDDARRMLFDSYHRVMPMSPSFRLAIVKQAQKNGFVPTP